MNEPDGGIDQGLVRALAHPLRVQILRILGKQVASPKQLADLVAQPPGKVAYHVEVLLGHGCVELVGEGRRRGATEDFYRAGPHAALGSRKWQEVPPSLRGDLVAASLDGFPPTVDEAGWRDLLEIAEDAERLDPGGT